MVIDPLLVALLNFLETNPGGGTSGVFIDITNLEWWQALSALIGALGLSPAPWLLGLATGKIQFSGPARKDFERQLVDLSAAHGRELEARDKYHGALMTGQQTRYADLERSNTANAEAAERERVRADAATEAVWEMAEVAKASAHVMASVGEAARMATEDQDGP